MSIVPLSPAEPASGQRVPAALREIGAALLLCAVVAVASTWPLAAHPTRIHSDIFTPAHLLVQAHISEWLVGRDPELNVLPTLEFPMGVHVQVVAWPTILLGAILSPLVGPVAGLNLAQIILLALGGVVFSRASARLGAPAPLLAGAAWTAQPLFLHFASTGQFENAAALPFALCAWGVAAGGLIGAAVLGLGVVAASFSSPYQVIVVGLFIGAGLLAVRPRLGWLLAGVALLALLPAWRYYGDREAHGRPEMGPGPSLERVYVQRPDSLFRQRVVALPRHSLESPFTATVEAQVAALKDAAVRRPDPNGVAESHSPYLGAAAGGLALIGLVGGRKRPIAWAALALAGSSLVLAMGDSTPGGTPLPWGLTRSLPNLNRMGMAYRFVTGIALAQAILCGWAAPKLRLRWAVPVAGVAAALIVVDGGGFSSFKLPMATRELRLAGGYAGLPDSGAVLPLPAAPMRDNATLPQLSSSFPPAMAVLHRHPIAYALSGEGPLHDLPLVLAARGKGDVTAEGVDVSLARLRSLRISYIVLDTTQLSRTTVTTLQDALTAALGPPAAEGDGVIGWRNP